MAPTTASSSVSDVAEGPVNSFINKRLRALRKKLNRITQIEESGKTLHKEQKKLLLSKPSILTLIEELEKIREPLAVAVAEEITLATKHKRRQKEEVVVVATPEVSGGGGANLEDLVNLLYLGSLTKTEERGSCVGIVGDRDLDLITKVWSLMVSRPFDSFLSHKDALEGCVEHAKLWLANSDKEIELNCHVSYAELREKLKLIIESDYFTTIPKVKAVVETVDLAIFSSDDETVVIEESVKDEEEKVELVTEVEVVNGQEEEDGYTLVGPRKVRREYVQRGGRQNGGYSNGRGGRGGGRREYSNGRGSRGVGGRGQQNGGRYESNDNSGGNGYQRSYYNNRGGRGRGGAAGAGPAGRGNGYANNNNNNNHQDSSVNVAS